MRSRGMAAAGVAPTLAPTDDVAAALGLESGEEIAAADLIDVVGKLLEPLGPYVLTYEIE